MNNVICMDFQTNVSTYSAAAHKLHYIEEQAGSIALCQYWATNERSNLFIISLIPQRFNIYGREY